MDLLVVGASVRAAASSLGRIGCRPVAFDLYADADLAALGPTTQIRAEDYPARIWDRVCHLPPTPWLYTGAIENHPDVVETLSRRFRLLGNGPSILRGVGDPFRLAEVVRRAGMDSPAIRTDPAGLPADGSWLVKPVASGGGERIIPWRGNRGTDSAIVCYQQRVGGQSVAAICVRDEAGVRLLGVTRQYHGRPGNRFAYRGSLGPWILPDPMMLQIARLGQVVGDSFGLLGIFGLDLMIEGDRVWLIEVNPRYTASVEVLEHALGRSLMVDHLRAFGLSPTSNLSTGAARFVAKAILYARSAGRMTEALPSGPTDDRVPWVSDIPRVGTEFEPGHPILTVWGRGESVAACRADLVRQTRAWRRWIGAARGGRIRPGC